MKFPRMGLALALLMLTGILLMTYFLLRYETRIKSHTFQDKGANMVSLMALYHIHDFEAGPRDLLIRTISENVSGERFLYLFVHDQTGKEIFSLANGEIASRVPPQVRTTALFNPAPMTQQFLMPGMDGTAYEFSTPLLEGGRKTGTIRLALLPTPVTLFSGERLSLIALMVYFVLAALILGYYGMLRRLKPFRDFGNRLLNNQNPAAASPGRSGGGNLQTVIDAMEKSAQDVSNQIRQIKEDNLTLVSRLGVATFDRRHTSSILDAIFFGIIITDAQENVININQYMLNLLHKKRADVIDRPLTAVIENPEILSYTAQQDNILRTKALKPIEISLPELEPGERFQVALSYLTNRAQELTGKMITIRNITSAKMAEESQQQFIAHVAHELLTPLTNIKSYSEMLMDGEVTDREMQREFYNTINGETSRLSRLIQTLLSIAKIEMGSLTINKSLVRTDWFLEGCLAAIEATARDKHLTIEKRMPDNFPSLYADKELLQGAIINILGNALKYTPEYGKITFAISDQDDAATFEVIDTGYGIAQEDLPHVFEKFYRSGNREITDQMGSGLGLAITAEIVRLHGGHIDMQSELGVGTHVTIRIPKEELYLGQT
ncbi:MAG: cell wall metabolism sensor histidine kinase WalK [Syntrophales bacterium]|jgi:PAS domain S-box-containing protein|nr:cell wall metabolism sensor histidine kinase WalK [Syntrophales bacterium]